MAGLPAGRKRLRLWPLWVRIDPTAQVVERTVLQHHDNYVLDLRQDLSHERISWKCMKRTRTVIESLMIWPAHDQAVPLASGPVARAISTCRTNQANYVCDGKGPELEVLSSVS